MGEKRKTIQIFLLFKMICMYMSIETDQGTILVVQIRPKRSGSDQKDLDPTKKIWIRPKRIGVTVISFKQTRKGVYVPVVSHLFMYIIYILYNVHCTLYMYNCIRIKQFWRVNYILQVAFL